MGVLRIPEPNPKQKLFFAAENRYIAYGGARGGGKSWAARIKAVLLALNYPGIQILFLRRTLEELRENHTIHLQAMLKEIAKYNRQEKCFSFPKGSRLVLGYCAAETDVLQYQGQAYDVIFMDEATLFTGFQFTALTESNRSSGMCRKPFTPRMYITCNPGGVGHGWVKRLFIDRDYRAKEKPEDYVFIPARVYDNNYLMRADPDYVRRLENLPEDRRRAMLLGDWNVFAGQYFREFREDIHVIEPFEIPREWDRYFVMDYGLDMLAGYWIAVDHDGLGYAYREFCEGDDLGDEHNGLIVSDAITEIQERTAEPIKEYIAPPDMWNRRQDTGKSIAELFAEAGIYLTRANNERVQGWYNLREWLKPFTGGVSGAAVLDAKALPGAKPPYPPSGAPAPDPGQRTAGRTGRTGPYGIPGCEGMPIRGEEGATVAGLRFFNTCEHIIRWLPQLIHDPKRPNDVSREPHEITHGPDALRYFVAGRPAPTARPEKAKHYNFEFEKPKEDPLGKGGKRVVL